MPRIVAAVAWFVVVGVVFTLLERRRGHRWWRRPDAGVDVGWALWALLGMRGAAKLVVAVVMGAAAVVVTGAPADAAALRTALAERDTLIASLPAGGQWGLALLVVDVVGYATHRAFHAWPSWWRFHAVHHSSLGLDWIAALRGRPVNEIAHRLAAALVLLVLGCPLGAAGGAPVVLGLYGILLHADVDWDFGPLRGVLASPHFHRWHHANQDGARGVNFAGLFVFLDRVFGTYHLPEARPQRFGVDDDVPRSVLGQLAWPFRRPPRIRGA